MKNLVFVLAVILFVTGAVTGGQLGAKPVRPYVIDNDPGGIVGTYLDLYRRLKDTNIPIKVVGKCASACTLVLSLPHNRVCVTPMAQFGFHLAKVNGVPRPDITALMVELYYPTTVQQWIADHGPLKEEAIYMSSDTLVKLGVFPYCHK